jgi:hypothetical protein
MVVFGFARTVALFLRKCRRVVGGSLREFRKLQKVKLFTFPNFMHRLGAVL